MREDCVAVLRLKEGWALAQQAVVRHPAVPLIVRTGKGLTSEGQGLSM